MKHLHEYILQGSTTIYLPAKQPTDEDLRK